MGTNDESSKTTGGGWIASGKRPTKACVWNKKYLDGSLHFFKTIDDYITTRDEIEADIDRFFSLSTIEGFVRKRFLNDRFLGKIHFYQLYGTFV